MIPLSIPEVDTVAINQTDLVATIPPFLGSVYQGRFRQRRAFKNSQHTVIILLLELTMVSYRRSSNLKKTSNFDKGQHRINNHKEKILRLRNENYFLISGNLGAQNCATMIAWRCHTIEQKLRYQSNTSHPRKNRNSAIGDRITRSSSNHQQYKSDQ